MAIQGAALLGFAARFGLRAVRLAMRHGGVSVSSGAGRAGGSVRFGPVYARGSYSRGSYRYRVGGSADPVSLAHGAARAYTSRRRDRGHPRRGQRR